MLSSRILFNTYYKLEYEIVVICHINEKTINTIGIALQCYLALEIVF